jgi:hypothetical protein
MIALKSKCQNPNDQAKHAERVKAASAWMFHAGSVLIFRIEALGFIRHFLFGL